jgi:site-specific recombinase XerD
MMTYSCSELGSIPSSSESPTPFRDLNRRKRIPPAPGLPESIPETSRERFSSAYEKKAKALRRALARVADWELPGKEYVAEYLRDMYRRNCKPSTFQGALFAIYLFLTGVKNSGKTSLAEITKDDLEYFIEQEQDRGIMISTVRTKLNFVNAFVRYWTEEGIIGVEVLARKIRLKRPDTLPRAIDPDDVQQLLSVIDQPRDRALVLVLLRTGMRIGELLNTRMSDIHLNDRKIDIYEGEKNRVGRVVYLSEDALRALQHWLKIRDPRQALLFYCSGHPTMSYSKARSLFEAMLLKAGLNHKGYTLHALRHTFATELLNAGMRLECLQPLLGHSSLDVTRRYARLTDKTREAEYFRAMAIIERGDTDGHDRRDRPLPAFLEA